MLSTRGKRIIASLVTLAALVPLATCAAEATSALMETRELAAEALPRTEYRLDRTRDSTQMAGIAATLRTIERRTARLSCRTGNSIDCEDVQ